jgi:hypothetical protein
MSAVTTRLAAGISELSSRSANGIDVALLWQHRDNTTVVVVVVDQRSGESLVLDVGEDDNALDIFNHPYAFAAQRRVDRGRVAALA